jgi:serine/threonine-protein kinase
MDLRDALQQKLGTAYAIERELGGGGMSRVFLAQEQALGRPVVVKLLPTDFAAELSIERFKREIALAASLQHPHIVAVLSAGDLDGMPYFVMPYVEGKSLRQRPIQGPLPVGEVVPILRDVARALAFAHDRGVVHRDVKPDNVLLAHGSAVLTDFGVAKALSDSQLEPAPAGSGAALTRVGTSLGTPDYMAPEQASGGEVDQRADLYAFGVMAYEILTGRSLPQLIAAHIAEAPPALPERRANVPASLAHLVMRCLEKDPAHRPQSAAEIVAALERPSVTSGPVATGATGRRGAGPRWAGIAAAVVVVGLAVLGAAMIGGRGPTPAAASDRSIAVLPFATVGADTANLYFAAGMTEQLTGALADVPGLRVASRTAGLAQGDPAKGPQELGRELGVTTLLEACLTWLDRAAEWREPFFASESMAAPLFDPLRGNPRFAALLRRVGFDPTLLAARR